MDEDDAVSDASSDLYGASTPQPEGLSLGSKRKAVDPALEDSSAKRSRGTTRPEIPCEVWQHIFSLVHPSALPSLLQVNKSFSRWLSDPATEELTPATKGTLRPRNPESVWRSSRQLWNPQFPTEAPPCSEPNLWRLLLVKECEFCGKVAAKPTLSGNKWEQGPGDDGVRIIWAFAIRSCGQCLRKRVQTDSALMLSDYSAIRSTAPFTFMTKSNHVVPSSTFHQNVSDIPSDLYIAKVYFTPTLELIQSQLDQMRLQSPKDAQSFFDALQADRSQYLARANAWDVGDLRGQLVLTPAASSRSTVRPLEFIDSRHGYRAVKTVSQNNTNTQHSYERTSSTSVPVERNLRSVNDAKAKRRMEIEQRCLALSPPIPKELLQHMEPFKASIQIPTALTEPAWEFLKPKLIAALPEANQKETERKVTEKALEEALTSPAHHQPADPSDIQQQEQSEEQQPHQYYHQQQQQQQQDPWELKQSFARGQLGAYVDEFLEVSWAGGRGINYETSPRFASDALVFARNRFVADSRRNGQEETQKPSLVLENMRWLYDTKIRTFTDRYRKECFLCNGCGESSKWYAFEGVIQHFGAKHTDTFSAGSVVVAWRDAPWPEHPPFQILSDPDSRRRHSQTPFYSNKHGSPPTAGYAGYPTGTPVGYDPRFHSSPIVPPYHNVESQFSVPGAIYSPLHPHGPHAIQYQSSQYPAGVYSAEESYGEHALTSPFGHRIPFGPHASNTPTSYHGGWSTGPFPPSSTSSATFSHAPPPPPPLPSSYPASPSQGFSSFFQAQLDLVASISRQVWDALSDVKPIPPSVRMYVIIHHVVSRFQDRFSNEPNLDLFTKCVVEHPSMGPIKDANGLACKTCVLNNESREEAHSEVFSLSEGERKLYPFHSLLFHFKNVHVEHDLAMKNASTHDRPENLHRLDWKEDMIELPKPSVIANLRRAPNMTSENFNFLRHVFTDLPALESAEQIAQDLMSNTRAGATLPPANSSGEIPAFIDLGPQAPTYVAADNSNNKNNSVYDTADIPLNREDEYDPRRPAFIESRGSSNRQIRHHHNSSWRGNGRYRAQRFHGGRARGDRAGFQTRPGPFTSDSSRSGYAESPYETYGQPTWSSYTTDPSAQSFDYNGYVPSQEPTVVPYGYDYPHVGGGGAHHHVHLAGGTDYTAHFQQSYSPPVHDPVQYVYVRRKDAERFGTGGAGNDYAH